ncbi:MAG: hypothetical protein NT027_11985 [Proteobacteria bacterium]|nr:hypothetical protein [Pseudomonadota bacterium]
MKFNNLVSILVIGSSLVASQSMALDVITKSRAVKGYGKRDRVFPVSSETVSPSQIHEVYGTRVDAGLDVTSSKSTINNDEVTATAPSISARGVMGGDILALGIAAGRSEIAGKADIDVEAKERMIANKFSPTAAITIADHVTLGASSELSWLEIRQNANGASEKTLNGYTRREAIGASFHASKWEIGLMHSTAAVSRATSDEEDNNGLTFGLASFTKSTSDARDLYIPASNTFFARGNMTPNWSLQGTVSHANYDKNVDGSKEALNDYRRADQIASQLQAVYWLDNEATRFAATASYRGAAHAPYGSDENTLGYRDANLYGGALDAVFEVTPMTYVGVRLSHLRGERDQDLADYVRLAAREERTTLGTTFSKTF